MTFTVISNKTPLILASASPRRKELLEQVKIPFRVLPGDVDEDGEKGEPYQICTRLAEKKAVHGYSQATNNWIIGADTIVVKDDTVMGKPANTDEASNMLKYLSDGNHEVITGFSIVNPSGYVSLTSHVRTIVKVKNLTQNEIDAYIKTGEPFGKAGGYAIQGIGAFMIKGMDGSYSNVVGLPLFEVIGTLEHLKAINHFPSGS